MAWVVHAPPLDATRTVAEAVAESLTARLDVELLEVAQAHPVPPGVGLLVVAASMTANTRPPLAAETTGAQDWLDLLGPSLPPIAFATFDTRVHDPRVPGSAAKGTARALRRLGGTQIAAPASFWVHGSNGSLRDGELDRARAWAGDLADVVAAPGADEPD